MMISGMDHSVVSLIAGRLAGLIGSLRSSPCITHPNKIFSNIKFFLCLTRKVQEMIVLERNLSA